MTRAVAGLLAALALTAAVLTSTTQARMAGPQASAAAPAPPAPPGGDTIQTYCVPCHADRRRSGGVSLAGFDLANPARDLEAAEKVIRKLRSGMMPPPGAKRPSPDVLPALADALESAIDAAAAGTVAPGARPFQRLTREEYARTVSDLVDVTIDATGLLPPDTVSAGFDNIADVQPFAATQVTSYLRAAAVVAERATSTGSNPKVFGCRPQTAAAEAACASRIVRDLTTRALRGTASPDDVSDALAFYTRGRQQGSFRQGIQLALQSILVSPRFVFRLEPVIGTGAVRRVGDEALASRLSYFIWGRAPDAALLAAARSGLNTPAAIDRQARRLLADPRSIGLASRFARQWLRLQALEDFTPATAAVPAFDRRLVTSMLRETELFVDSLVRADRSVLELLTADYTFVDQRLAAHYGLPPLRGTGFVRVMLPDSRRGLLGQGSVLMATSLAERTSPVLRGKWVMEVLLGTPPPPPPPNVPSLDDSAKVVQNGVRLSTRQRIEVHRKSPQCASCHRFIDPWGMTLEQFDVTGAWRTEESGAAIDARGELFDGTAMDGPAGLRRALLDRQTMVLRTFTENLLTYALGRRLDASDMPVVRAIVRSAAADSYRMSSFILGVAASAPFTMTSAAR
jgi:mono/diheme cytochrome c family protein